MNITYLLTKQNYFSKNIYLLLISIYVKKKYKTTFMVRQRE